MFGKKKAAAGGDGGDGGAVESKPKAKSRSKSKSVKHGHSVNFFAAHAEKLVLGLVVLAAGYLIYDGIGGKGYDSSRKPPQLEQSAETLLKKIRDGDPWPELEEERTIVHDFAKRTEEARMPSDPSLYPVPVMEVQDKGAYEKRGDPELAAPIRVVGQSVVGLIAVEAPENAIDPFEDFEDAKKLEGKKKSTRSSRQAQAMAAASGMGTESATGMSTTPGAEGGMTNTPLQRFFPSQYNKGFSLGGVGGMGMGMGMESGYGGDAMGGMASTMGGTPTGSTSGSLTGGPVIKQKKPQAKPVFFNAVTALVEHEALIKEYNAKLRESASFMLPRDLPIYLSFEVQRVEVTKPNQKFEDKDWKTVTDAAKQILMSKNWMPKYPQRVPDVIDPAAFDGALTMPIPPMLIHDYRRFAKHPDIDWVWDAGMAQMQNQMQMPDPTQNLPDPSSGILPGELPGVGGMGMGMGMGMDSAMMGGGMDSGYGSGMGMGMGYGDATAGMMGGGMGGYGAGMDSGGYGMGMESGGYGMGMSMMPAKYKMIRFYDQLSEKDVRKTFKYRVRVMLEDPNYPSDRFQAPRQSDLKDDVFVRVAQLRRKEDPEAEKVRKENAKLRPGTQHKVYNRTKRFTPWSQESNPIYVRGTEDVYIGKFPKKTGDPVVDAVLVKLDTQKGAYVPMFSFVTEDTKEVRLPPFRRGAVLIFQKLTTQFAHPITMVMKQWPDYNFTGWSTVVDIRGNDPLALSDKDDPMSDIGEMMVLMGDGRIEVTNEFDDAFWYRAFTLADEREGAENGTGATTDGMGGAMGSPY